MKTVRETVLDALDMFYAKIKGLFVTKEEIVDNCQSTSTTCPLSANQGRLLQNSISSIASRLSGGNSIGFIDTVTNKTCILSVENNLLCLEIEDEE